MAWQKDDYHSTSKNSADQCSSVSGNYVKNVAVIFEEKVDGTAPMRGPVQVQKSRNVRISFRLNDRLNSKLPSRSVTRNTDCNTLKYPVNTATLDMVHGRKDTLPRPTVRQLVIASDKTNNPMATSPTNLLDAKKQMLPDTQKCRSATDLQLAANTESSQSRCGHATLSLAIGSLHVENGTANIHNASVGCG